MIPVRENSEVIIYFSQFYDRPLSRFFRLFDGEFTFKLTRHPFLAGADLSQLTAGFW